MVPGLVLCVALLPLSVIYPGSSEMVNIHRSGFGMRTKMSRAKLMFRLDIGKDETLRSMKSFKTRRGRVKVKLQQQYYGVPVYGSHVVTEISGGFYTGWTTGRLARRLKKFLKDRSAVIPRLQPLEAIDVCRKAHGHPKTGIQKPHTELFIHPGLPKLRKKAPSRASSLHNTRYTPPRLVYVVTYLLLTPRQPMSPLCIVDAKKRGRVWKTWDNLKKQFPYLANSFGGTTKTGKHTYSSQANSKYPPLSVSSNTAKTVCSLNTSGVSTYDFQKGLSWPPYPKTFGCTEGNMYDSVNGGYSALSDAHFCATKVKRFFLDTLNTLPTDGWIYLAVHVGYNWDTAFYYNSYFFFGDGNRASNLSYPLTSCDVVGHEIGHGFTAKKGNANLEYWGESGAIDEAFCDMVGEAVEHYVDNTNDYKIGASIFKLPNLGLRDMCNPRVDGRSISHYSQYHAKLNIHFASGLYNRVFCVLAKEKGLGIIPTFKVFAIANEIYWDKTTTFNSGVCGVLSAARDEGYSTKEVTSAFAEVGLSCNDPR